MGSALHIPLPGSLRSGGNIEVKIVYKTTKGSVALQWLAKECVGSMFIDLQQISKFLKGNARENFSLSVQPVSTNICSLYCAITRSEMDCPRLRWKLTLL